MSTPTGHLLYSWNEKYVSPADVDEHMKVGDAKWEDFPKLLKLVKTNGHFMISGHGKIVANYNDCSEPCTARKGDTTVSLGLIVPAKLERDVDAAWRQHEQWMRKTHDFGEGKFIFNSHTGNSTDACFVYRCPRQVRRPRQAAHHQLHRHQSVRTRRSHGPQLHQDR